jgi:predicted transcriptional regulator
MEAKIQICVRLKKEYIDELDKLAKEHDLPKTWFIQQAVKQFVEAKKGK